MKRYCQTLRLRENKELIEEYILKHKSVPAIVQQGMRSVGIVDMQIYIKENTLFMIMDTVDNFDWDRDNEALSKLPGQAEWEEIVSIYQDAEAGSASHEKWVLMDKIFELEKQ